jgi:hypothetical protein
VTRCSSNLQQIRVELTTISSLISTAKLAC